MKTTGTYIGSVSLGELILHFGQAALMNFSLFVLFLYPHWDGIILLLQLKKITTIHNQTLCVCVHMWACVYLHMMHLYMCSVVCLHIHARVLVLESVCTCMCCDCGTCMYMCVVLCLGKQSAYTYTYQFLIIWIDFRNRNIAGYYYLFHFQHVRRMSFSLFVKELLQLCIFFQHKVIVLTLFFLLKNKKTVH